MKKIIAAGIAMVFAGTLTFYYLSGSQSLNNKVYAELEKHKITDIEKLKGNYVIVHFWAKWCEPCIEEIPELVAFASKVKSSKPLLILAVSLDPSLEVAKQIFPDGGASLPTNFILALDPEHRFAEAVGSYQYPESYLMNPNGEIIEKWVGPQKWNRPEVLDYFSKRLD